MTNPEDEIARLQALLAEQEATLAAKEADLAKAERTAASLARKNKTLAEKVKALEHELALLKKQLFGKSSEKVDPEQLKLEFDQAIAEAEAAEPPLTDEPVPGKLFEELAQTDVLAPPVEDDQKRRRRDRFPPNLEVVPDDEIHPPASDLHCSCGCEKIRLGEERSRRLALIPQRFHWREQVRVKYVCPGCKAITRPELPPAPIDKCLADTSLLVDVLLSKYLDHLPLDRLERIYSRNGVELRKSTLWSWVEALTQNRLLGAVADEVGRQVCTRPVLQTDETGMLVLDPEHPEGRFKGRMWVFCGETGELFYEYTRTKETRWPRARLAGFEGCLQADAYPGFDALFRDGKIVEAGCNAHARRKFKDAHDAEPSREATKFALLFYQRLFACEREARERALDHTARLALRQQKAAPLVKQFYAWLKQLKPKWLPSDPLYAAVRYALNHRTALSRFLKDGRVELDNNRSERSLRQVAVGRKNWLFAGSPRGAAAAATAYTLIMSCKELGVPVRDYLVDVLNRRAANPDADVAELTPRAWQAAREDAVLS